eukprot:gene24699-29849_t
MSKLSKVDELRAKLASIAEKQKRERLAKGKEYLKTHNGNLLLSKPVLVDTNKKQKEDNLQALKVKVRELNWHPRKESGDPPWDSLDQQDGSKDKSSNNRTIKDIEARRHDYNLPMYIDKLLSAPLQAPIPPFPEISKEFSFVDENRKGKGNPQQTIVKLYDAKQLSYTNGSLAQTATQEINQSSNKENGQTNREHEGAKKTVRRSQDINNSVDKSKRVVSVRSSARKANSDKAKDVCVSPKRLRAASSKQKLVEEKTALVRDSIQEVEQALSALQESFTATRSRYPAPLSPSVSSTPSPASSPPPPPSMPEGKGDEGEASARSSEAEDDEEKVVATARTSLSERLRGLLCADEDEEEQRSQPVPLPAPQRAVTKVEVKGRGDDHPAVARQMHVKVVAPAPAPAPSANAAPVASRHPPSSFSSQLPARRLQILPRGGVRAAAGDSDEEWATMEHRHDEPSQGRDASRGAGEYGAVHALYKLYLDSRQEQARQRRERELRARDVEGIGESAEVSVAGRRDLDSPLPLLAPTPPPERVESAGDALDCEARDVEYSREQKGRDSPSSFSPYKTPVAAAATLPASSQSSSAPLAENARVAPSLLALQLQAELGRQDALFQATLDLGDLAGAAEGLGLGVGMPVWMMQMLAERPKKGSEKLEEPREEEERGKRRKKEAKKSSVDSSSSPLSRTLDNVQFSSQLLGDSERMLQLYLQVSQQREQQREEGVEQGLRALRESVEILKMGERVEEAQVPHAYPEGMDLFYAKVMAGAGSYPPASALAPAVSSLPSPARPVQTPAPPVPAASAAPSSPLSLLKEVRERQRGREDLLDSVLEGRGRAGLSWGRGELEGGRGDATWSGRSAGVEREVQVSAERFGTRDAYTNVSVQYDKNDKSVGVGDSMVVGSGSPSRSPLRAVPVAAGLGLALQEAEQEEQDRVSYDSDEDAGWSGHRRRETEREEDASAIYEDTFVSHTIRSVQEEKDDVGHMGDSYEVSEDKEIDEVDEAVEVDDEVEEDTMDAYAEDFHGSHTSVDEDPDEASLEATDAVRRSKISDSGDFEVQDDSEEYDHDEYKYPTEDARGPRTGFEREASADWEVSEDKYGDDIEEEADEVSSEAEEDEDTEDAEEVEESHSYPDDVSDAEPSDGDVHVPHTEIDKSRNVSVKSKELSILPSPMESYAQDYSLDTNTQAEEKYDDTFLSASLDKGQQPGVVSVDKEKEEDEVEGEVEEEIEASEQSEDDGEMGTGREGEESFSADFTLSHQLPAAAIAEASASSAQYGYDDTFESADGAGAGAQGKKEQEQHDTYEDTFDSAGGDSHAHVLVPKEGVAFEGTRAHDAKHKQQEQDEDEDEDIEEAIEMSEGHDEGYDEEEGGKDISRDKAREEEEEEASYTQDFSTQSLPSSNLRPALPPTSPPSVKGDTSPTPRESREEEAVDRDDDSAQYADSFDGVDEREAPEMPGDGVRAGAQEERGAEVAKNSKEDNKEEDVEEDIGESIEEEDEGSEENDGEFSPSLSYSQAHFLPTTASPSSPGAAVTAPVVPTEAQDEDAEEREGWDVEVQDAAIASFQLQQRPSALPSMQYDAANQRWVANDGVEEVSLGGFSDSQGSDEGPQKRVEETRSPGGVGGAVSPLSLPPAVDETEGYDEDFELEAEKPLVVAKTAEESEESEEIEEVEEILSEPDEDQDQDLGAGRDSIEVSALEEAAADSKGLGGPDNALLSLSVGASVDAEGPGLGAVSIVEKEDKEEEAGLSVSLGDSVEGSVDMDDILRISYQVKVRAAEESDEDVSVGESSASVSASISLSASLSSSLPIPTPTGAATVSVPALPEDVVAVEEDKEVEAEVDEELLALLIQEAILDYQQYCGDEDVEKQEDSVAPRPAAAASTESRTESGEKNEGAAVAEEQWATSIERASPPVPKDDLPSMLVRTHLDETVWSKLQSPHSLPSYLHPLPALTPFTAAEDVHKHLMFDRLEELVAEVHRGLLGVGGDRGNRLLACLVVTGAGQDVGLSALRKYFKQKLKAEELSLKVSEESLNILSEDDCALFLTQVIKEAEEERCKCSDEIMAEILRRELNIAITDTLQVLGMDDKKLPLALQPG